VGGGLLGNIADHVRLRGAVNERRKLASEDHFGKCVSPVHGFLMTQMHYLGHCLQQAWSRSSQPRALPAQIQAERWACRPRMVWCRCELPNAARPCEGHAVGS
jgi:hypothetical protein